ncbi:hypothetical protein AU184_18455 [Mycolicibacterium novocastrense]|uniref:DoxX family protein n=1 Tax=Mycolicibacterium novocastrense TaxID=59813 RepID=UPI0007483D30|nr:hypothetical protein [Mycolicibacterium novocastrense]KUH65556.1 hypothetical protein AU184_18455 [Mycolicibacterium novocastrense]KUH77381.1 hypothetical protein AU072_22065 [Mycolicibacterium novocastrense]KUH77712.1 hypothetical protein AU183_22055 [Mycolicibacterium novocastrense]
MTSPPPELQQVANPTRAYRMAAGLLGIGTLHFVAPKPFDGIIPAELPGSPRFYTYASGVAELGVAGLLLAPKTRRLGALAAVALFVAVFPGNVNMVRLWWDKPWPMRAIAIARLPLQIPMIVEAVKVYRES